MSVAPTSSADSAAPQSHIDVDRAIRVVANGLDGEITVNGETYDSVMPRLAFSHEDTANVLTYVYSQWDNNGTEVTREHVEKVLGPEGT